MRIEGAIFDLFKTFDEIDGSHKSYLILGNDFFVLLARATCSELPYNIMTMVQTIRA